MKHVNNNPQVGMSMLCAYKSTADIITEHARNGWHSVGRERQSVIDEINKDAEALKAAMLGFGDLAMSITGSESLKYEIDEIVRTGLEVSSNCKITAMAVKVRNTVSRYIRSINSCDASGLSEVMSLKAVIGDGSNKPTGKGIVGEIAACLIWLANKVSSLLKQWYGAVVRTSGVFATIMRSIGVLSKLSLKIRARDILSYTVLSSGTKGIDYWVLNTIASLFLQVKTLFEVIGKDSCIMSWVSRPLTGDAEWTVTDERPLDVPPNINEPTPVFYRYDGKSFAWDYVIPELRDMYETGMVDSSFLEDRIFRARLMMVSAADRNGLFKVSGKNIDAYLHIYDYKDWHFDRLPKNIKAEILAVPGIINDRIVRKAIWLAYMG